MQENSSSAEKDLSSDDFQRKLRVPEQSVTETADLALNLAESSEWNLVTGSLSPNLLDPNYLYSVKDIFKGGVAQDVHFIKKSELAAIRAGTSSYDCTADLQAMLDSGARFFIMGPGIFNISAALNIPKGSKLVGSGSGMYFVIGGGLAEQNSGQVTLIQTTHTGPNSRAIILQRHAVIEDICIRPARYDLVDYQDATYGARAISEGRTDPATVNAQFGLHMYAGSVANRVTIWAFALDNFILGITSRCSNCHSFMAGAWGYNTRGEAITDNASDGTLIDCVGMFCALGGGWIRGNFWKVIGGRWEWNANYGIRSGGESVITGATFDRNGWAGIHMNSGAWGTVVVVNYFARNGVGGNGTTGRWKESVPGHYSYVDTPANLSAHIQIDYQHAATITGNRYRSGLSDANNGAAGPAYVYTSASSSGASPRSGITISANEGELNSSVTGFEVTYPGASGLAVGGTDATLISFLKHSMQNLRNGALTRATTSQNSTTSPVSTLAISVPYRSSGIVYVYAGKASTAPAICEILIATNPGGGSRSAVKTVKTTGADSTNAGYISTVTYTAGTDGATDILTINFIEAVFVNYAIGHGGMAA